MMRMCKANCPKFLIVKKCCFCVPVRQGVIIFGYVNLVITLLIFPMLVFLLVRVTMSSTPEVIPSVNPLVHLSLTIAFTTIDVAMTIVMLVGAHKKKKILLQVYFYFGVVFQLLTLCIDLVYFDYRDYMDNLLYSFIMGLNIYLLFLVYNTIHLIEESTEVQYIAHRDQHNVNL